MAKGFSETTVVGYIRTEPAEKYTPAGKAVLEFSVPYENYKGETIWFNCAVWGEKRVQSLSWLKKGMGVFLRGDLTVTAKGDKIYHNLNVGELQVIGGQKQDDEVPF